LCEVEIPMSITELVSKIRFEHDCVYMNNKKLISEHVTGITLTYTQSQKIAKPNNLEVFWSKKTKGQNRIDK
jgi:hypothetical protein